MVQKKTSWSSEKKKKVQAALTMDLMSSEEDGEEDGNSVFIVRPLPWVTPEMQRIKSQLDQKYAKKMTARSRRQYLQRVEGEPSRRPVPTKVNETIQWAIDNGL